MYNNYPFKLSYTLFPPGYFIYNSIHKIDLSDIGISIREITKDFRLTMSCVCYYGERKKVLKKDITCFKDMSYKLDCNLINEAFIYDLEYKTYPNQIEVIFFVEDCAPFKWILEINGGD